MRRRSLDDRGAAAVEFALVVPILAVLLLGILDYGLYFNDRLALRDGIREGARHAAAEDQDACPGPDLDCLADYTRDRINAAGGQTFVRVETDPSGWQEGHDIVVCAVVMSDSLTGVTPLPDRSTGLVRMRLEHNTTSGNSGQTGVPPGDDWSWCS